MKSVIQEYFDGADKVSKKIIKEGDVVVSEYKYNLDGYMIECIDYLSDGKPKFITKYNDKGELHGYQCITEYDDKGIIIKCYSYTNGKLGWDDKSKFNYMWSDDNGVMYAVILTSGKINNYREYDKGTCIRFEFNNGKIINSPDGTDTGYEPYIEGNIVKKRKRVSEGMNMEMDMKVDETITRIITMLSSATKEYNNEILSVYKSGDKMIIIEGDTLRWK